MPVNTLSRYRDLSVIEVATNNNGSLRSLPLRRSVTQPPSSAKKHRYLDYEPVDLIAKREYGNEYLYWAILELNGVNFPDELQSGKTIFIAPLNQITRVSRG